MTAHRYRIEYVIHYKCSACARWWSIGDGPTTGQVYCPWCGCKHTLIKSENYGGDAAPVRTINDAEAGGRRDDRQ